MDAEKGKRLVREFLNVLHSGDADGAVPARAGNALLNTRLITGRVRVEPQASMDAALARIIALSKKLQESEITDGGLPVVWTPAQATTGPL